MIVDCFLDTNILVNAAPGRGREDMNRQVALKLIEETEFGLSAQVLQEFFVTVTRKIGTPLSAMEALEWIEQLEIFPCIAVDRSLVKIAVEVSERYRISYWDGAIVAAANALGANTLYSEDLSHGQVYGTVTLRNPFLQ